MAKSEKKKWNFAPRFRCNAFGWRSQPAIARVKQAVSEIRKSARSDPTLAAEGAVLFLEKVSPALEQVDSSSGAIGTAVNHAIRDLVPIIASARADEKIRHAWLERLWKAHEADKIPYIELLADYWGELCASKEVASTWADRLVGITRMALSPDKNLRGHFHGTTACLSALYFAERYAEVVDILAVESFWRYKRWAVRALTAMGRKADAIRAAEGQVDQQDRAYVVNERTKNGERFVWPLERWPREYVEKRVEESRFPGDYLFPGPKGGDPRASLIRVLPDVIRAAGLRYGRKYKDGVTFHTFRHSIASLALNHGAPEVHGATDGKLEVARHGAALCAPRRRGAAQGRSDNRFFGQRSHRRRGRREERRRSRQNRLREERACVVCVELAICHLGKPWHGPTTIVAVRCNGNAASIMVAPSAASFHHHSRFDLLSQQLIETVSAIGDVVGLVSQ